MPCRILFITTALSLAVLSSGCRREEIRTYATPKEKAPALAPAPAAGKAPAGADADAAMRNTPVTVAEGPGLAWTAPDDWSKGDDRPMRKATFVISGDNGEVADLAITAFPGDVGGNLANVNRWRQQLGVGPVSEAELTRLVQHIHVGQLHVDVVELTGPGAPPARRVLGAIVPYQGSTWFFKLDGPDTLVTREKSAFLAFVQTIRPQY